jgi:hypothetical protein
MEFFKELLCFQVKRKKLLLFPVILMILVVFLFVLNEGTMIAPVYTFF